MNSTPNTPAVPQTKRNHDSSGELKILAEGFHSSITNPFVAVIRDPETYLALNKREPNLPKLEADFFKTKVIVAAFLGERNTGGYGVHIAQGSNGEIRISEQAPGKGMVVPQVITSPFKLVSVSIEKGSSVSLEFGPVWSSKVRHYSLTKGIFTMSGGFAGRTKEFRLVGHIGSMREQGLISLSFTLRNSVENNKVMLADFTTGTIQGNGLIRIPILSAGALINPPTNGLEAKGKLANYDRDLSIDLISLPTMISDGYNGSGSIAAVLVTPTAKR